MKLFIKSTVLATVLAMTAACAGPQFPESGSPTSFDGLWSATLPAEKFTCGGIESKFEIRYGMLIGTVSEKGRRMAEIWGQIDDKGHMEGLIGQLGITGATASINFQPDSATGTWKSKQCKGTVDAKKIG
ncbi:hypothetical protein ACFL12_04340 [Pseudomonadota bacterium]